MLIAECLIRSWGRKYSYDDSINKIFKSFLEVNEQRTDIMNCDVNEYMFLFWKDTYGSSQQNFFVDPNWNLCRVYRMPICRQNSKLSQYFFTGLSSFSTDFTILTDIWSDWAELTVGCVHIIPVSSQNSNLFTAQRNVVIKMPICRRNSMLLDYCFTGLPSFSTDFTLLTDIWSDWAELTVGCVHRIPICSQNSNLFTAQRNVFINQRTLPERFIAPKASAEGACI